MEVRRWLGLSVGIVLLASACSERPPQLILEPRAFVDVAGDTIWGEFGYLSVPLRHEQPGHDSIELAVARFRARSSSGSPPIVYLEGGPGAAGIHPERLPLLQRLRDHGDVVTFDQRGTGASRPHLGCGAAVELSASEAQSRQAWLEAERRQARRCARDLRARGIDLQAFNVLESVGDVDDIRVALGADQIRLVGISFGSHLGLAAMKQLGPRVQRAVLAGVEGLDQTIKLPSDLDAHLSRVSRLIAADSVAGRVLPDLEGLVREVATELDREPRVIGLGEDSVILTGFKFRRLVAGSIVRRQFLRYAPEEFGPILEGDYGPLAAVAGLDRVAPFGMRAAMDCTSGVPPDRWARVEAERRTTLLQGVADFPFPDVCDAWGIGSVGAEVWEPFRFPGAVLFITGTLDGLTPISNVDEIRGGFPASGHLIVESMGHEGPGLWFASPAVLGLVGRFLEGDPVPDTMVSAPPIDWVLPDGS